MTMVFHLFDDDCTGKISFENLKRIAEELEENLTDEELQVLSTCPQRRTCADGWGLFHLHDKLIKIMH